MYVFRITSAAKLVAGISLLALAMPAQARVTAAEASNQSATSTEEGSGMKQDTSRLVCKRFAQTGSRIKTFRACHTREDWQRLENGEV
jgi:hypothetical protein